MASALCYKNDEFAFITNFELEVGHQSPLQCITGAPGQTSFIAAWLQRGTSAPTCNISARRLGRNPWVRVADRTEAAAVDHYFLLSTANISVSVCLWTPGYRLMIVSRRAVGLPEWSGGAQYEYHSCSYSPSSHGVHSRPCLRT